jgi:hypothetical protein
MTNARRKPQIQQFHAKLLLFLGAFVKSGVLRHFFSRHISL